MKFTIPHEHNFRLSSGLNGKGFSLSILMQHVPVVVEKASPFSMFD